MNYRTALCLGIILATAIIRPASAITIVGEGLNSCGSWIEERNSSSYGLKAQWVAGFLSGVNMFANLQVTTNDALKQLGDMSAILVWMDNHCRSHPLDTLGVGARLI